MSLQNGRRRIEDYALIGDCETAALVGYDGSIDWLCWPRFDSEACFAALLGTPQNGRWLISPVSRVTGRSRGYRGSSLILETRFETDRGAVCIVDFMPVRGRASDVVRIVVGERGEVPLTLEIDLRFAYGERAPRITHTDERNMEAVAGPHAAVLNAGIPCALDGHRIVAQFTVKEGQRIPFVLTYGPSHRPPKNNVDPEKALDQTERFWARWSGQCTYDGPWKDAVLRSLVSMKALTYRPTGGIVAAPTTSLPERAGGSRNWDYRFCWLRDATFTLLSLMGAGYREEAQEWTDWLLRAVAGMPDQIQPVYGVAGEHWLGERESQHLSGFNGARPVRIGNAAFEQRQIDIFGEVMDALHHARLSGLELREADWSFQKALLGHLEKIWEKPDDGIWEMRGDQQQFVHSKVMAWVAFDRAVKAIGNFGLDGPEDRWSKVRDRIHAEVCDKGFNAQRGAFVQFYGSDELDAANLLIPLVGFLPCEDPRVVATVGKIEHELVDRGLVKRYRSEQIDDGLPAGESTFLACSFWLADNLALQGRYEDAAKLFEHLLSLRNDVGLLAEEYDVLNNCQMGNFPQALSHLTLVNTAFNLAQASGPAKKRSEEGKEERSEPQSADAAAK